MRTSPLRPRGGLLTTWLQSSILSRALIIEDGTMGSLSPLARWIEEVRVAGTHEVISASMGPEATLVLERDILVELYVELYPDEPEVPATFSLAHLRDHVRSGLRADEADRIRLVALD